MPVVPGDRAVERGRRRSYQRWHRLQSKLQILRSQMGFARPVPTRPLPCQGCRHYHGAAYGTQRDRRIALICAIHPYGWRNTPVCPDWSDAG
jgi:hypothetical protein